MIHERDLLDGLEKLDPVSWSGIVFRHMLGDYPPSRENTRGARWNPPGVAAIYTSLERDTALAEAEYRLSLEPIPVRAPRTIYTIRISLGKALDLTSRDFLQDLGLAERDLLGDDRSRCQRIGAAVAWLAHDGVLVPSARSGGTNLVIYPTELDPASQFDVVDQESI